MLAASALVLALVPVSGAVVDRVARRGAAVAENVPVGALAAVAGRAGGFGPVWVACFAAARAHLRAAHRFAGRRDADAHCDLGRGPDGRGSTGPEAAAAAAAESGQAWVHRQRKYPSANP